MSMRRTYFDVDERMRRAAPGAFLAFCLICCVCVGLTTLIIVLLVQTNSGPPTPTPSPTPTLFCLGYSDLLETEQPIDTDPIGTCSQTLFPGSCNAAGTCSVGPYNTGGTSDAPESGITDCVPSDGCTVGEGCACPGVFLCARNILVAGTFLNPEAFLCTTEEPTPEPTPAFRCGQFNPDTVSVQSESLTCTSQPRAASGVCTEANVCRPAFVADRASAVGAVVPVPSQTMSCFNSLCTAPNLAACSCILPGNTACIRTATRLDGTMLSRQFMCVDANIPTVFDFE